MNLKVDAKTEKNPANYYELIIICVPSDTICFLSSGVTYIFVTFLQIVENHVKWFKDNGR